MRRLIFAVLAVLSTAALVAQPKLQLQTTRHEIGKSVV